MEGREAYGELRTTLLEPGFPFDRVYRLISRMPAFACHLLRLANSSNFAGRTPIDRLDRAIILVGRHALVDLAKELTSQVGREPRIPGLDPARFVDHHITVSEAAVLIAQAAQLPLEHEARTAGLIHDIGLQLQMQRGTNAFVSAYEDSQAGRSRLIEHERFHCGTDHCELAEELLVSWNVPESLALAIGYHHDPLTAPDHRYLAIIIYAAECLTLRAGFSGICGEKAHSREDEVLSELRISPEALETHVPILKHQLAAAESALVGRP